METLLVSKNGIAWSATLAAGTANSLTTRSQINDLKDGSLTAFEENGARVVATGSFTKTDTHGRFFLGTPDGVSTRRSPRINWATLKYNKNAYRAAVAQTTVMGDDGVADKTTGAFAAGDVGTQFVCTVASTAGDFQAGSTGLLKVVSTGLTLAASTELVLGEKYEVIAAGTPDAWGGATLASSLAGTLVIGTKALGASYGVTVHDLSKETWERNQWEVSLTMTSASMTDAQMLTALAAAFNANPNAAAIATCSVLATDKGLKFVGVNAGESFKIYPQGILYGTTTAQDGSGISDPAIQGEGTNAQIAALEVATSSVEGRTSTYVDDEVTEIWKMPSMVEVGQTYVVYVLEWTDQREVAYPSNNANPSHKRLNIAVPSGDSTMITAIDNVLGDLVA